MRTRMAAVVGAVLLACLMSMSANATVFSGTASGEWDNVVSTNASDVYSVNNNDVGGTARFNWGVPANPTPFDNQFEFDGIGSDGDPGWTTNSETPFLVGLFTYRNGSTFNSSGIDGVELKVTLNITSPLARTTSPSSSPIPRTIPAIPSWTATSSRWPTADTPPRTSCTTAFSTRSTCWASRATAAPRFATTSAAPKRPLRALACTHASRPNWARSFRNRPPCPSWAWAWPALRSAASAKPPNAAKAKSTLRDATYVASFFFTCRG